MNFLQGCLVLHTIKNTHFLMDPASPVQFESPFSSLLSLLDMKMHDGELS